MDLLAEYEDINLKFGLPEYYENEEKMNGALCTPRKCKISLMQPMPGASITGWKGRWRAQVPRKTNP